VGFEVSKAMCVEEFDIKHSFEQASKLAECWSMHCDASRLREEILRTFNLAIQNTTSGLKSSVIRVYDQVHLEINVSRIDQDTLRVCWQQRVADFPTHGAASVSREPPAHCDNLQRYAAAGPNMLLGSKQQGCCSSKVEKVGFEVSKAMCVEEFDIKHSFAQASKLAECWSMHCDASRLQEEILRTFNLAVQNNTSGLKSSVIRLYDQVHLEINVSRIDPDTLRVCWQQRVADFPTHGDRGIRTPGDEGIRSMETHGSKRLMTPPMGLLR